MRPPVTRDAEWTPHAPLVEQPRQLGKAPSDDRFSGRLNWLGSEPRAPSSRRASFANCVMVERVRRIALDHDAVRYSPPSDRLLACRCIYPCSTNSMMSPSGSLAMAIRMSGKTCVSGTVNSTPFALSTVQTPLRSRIMKQLDPGARRRTWPSSPGSTGLPSDRRRNGRGSWRVSDRWSVPEGSGREKDDALARRKSAGIGLEELRRLRRRALVRP